MSFPAKNTMAFDETNPEFLAFVALFSDHEMNKEKTHYRFSEEGSSIADCITNPPHFALIIKLLNPDTVYQLYVLAKEFQLLTSSWWMDTIPDFYNTTYEMFAFEIHFIDLFLFYTKYNSLK